MIEQARVVDWHELIEELRRQHGMTRLDIAKQVGLAVETLRTYIGGLARPKHHDGEALIILWMRVTTKSRDQLPTEPMPLSASRAKRG